MSSTYYSTIAKSYNELHGEEQKKKLEVVKSLIHPKPTDILLDIGCGTGISSDWPCTVVGIDSSEKLIEIARQDHLGKTFIVGFAEKLPFTAGYFDFCICLTALHNFSSSLIAMQEITRVVKSKKRNIIISVLKKSKNYNDLCIKLRTHFTVIDCVDNSHDTIFCLTKF